MRKEKNYVVDVTNVSSPEITREHVSAIVRDPELRKLKPGSPEYQTALAKKFPNDGTKPAASEPAISGGKAKTNNEAPAKAEASDDETIEGIDRNAVSTAVNKKIAKLISERNAEMALRTNLEKRIAELEAAGKTPKQAEKQATVEVQGTQFDKPKPKLGDFGNIEDYNDAYADWKFDKREFETAQTSRTKAAQESDKAIFDKFWSEGSKFEKEQGLDEGDFKTLIENDGVRKYPSTVRTILESEVGPQIAYELANLDEAEKERFGKMSDTRQVAYIGRLEAKLEKKQQTETPAISAAKAPGKPLKKGTGSSTATVTSGMSYQEYKAARKAQNPEKFRR
jgi:hypothetical protein